jgi:adenylosuccinate lyase
MEPRDIFDNLSPLDHRYWQANKDIFDALSLRLSETGQLACLARVEGALVQAHLEARGLADEASRSAIAAAVAATLPADVYTEEERTHHAVRALVNVFQLRLKEAGRPELCPLVHLGATSADILDTGRALCVRGAVQEVLIPLMARVEAELCRLAIAEADTPQVGRTHGQHAVPITFGFAMAEYASRFGASLLAVEAASSRLVGKLSGATGSYNALSMSYADPEAFEAAFLSLLGLAPGESSTQIVEPEPLLRLLLELNTAFGVLANLSDDLRNLQRSEIAEVHEAFGADQVGSSTMPQKRNPWNSEHVKSLWKAFAPRAMTFFMDQVSEHQRDLTNSASERFVVDYLAGFAAAAGRELKVLRGLVVDRGRMAANLGLSGGAVLAEPAYILLAEAGRADAHEILRRITLKAEAEGLAFHEALLGDRDIGALLDGRLAALGLAPAAEFFSRPEAYRGRAAQKARAIGLKYSALAARLSGAGDASTT